MEARGVDVPFFDFRSVPFALREQWVRAFNATLDSGVFIGGRAVTEFETQLAEEFAVAGAVGVGNGLDALSLALRGLGVGDGHVVAVPAHTFIATWLAVLQVGATPLAVDVNAKGVLDVSQLIAYSGHVDAVVPVHLHGTAVDMSKLMDWAYANDVLVVEDCAQAHGLHIDGKPVGSWGNAGAFSFYPTKNLGALGDAGAVISDSRELLSEVRQLANYGAAPDDKYLHKRVGLNSRLDPIQASLLGLNLRHLHAWNRRRSEIAAFYLEALRGHPYIRPMHSASDQSVWHHFVVQVDDRYYFQHALRQRHIGTDVHYPYLALNEVTDLIGTSAVFKAGPIQTAPMIASKVVSIPMHQWLTDEQVERVAQAMVDISGSQI